MSRTCIKCSKGVVHDISICLKNYVGSSKGMEATSATRITNRLFETGKVVIAKHVGDDDSSCHLVVRHSFIELIGKEKMQSADWPRYNGESKANPPDNGLLPVGHPPIIFRADKGHRVRNYAKSFFALSLKPKKEKKGFPSVDAEQEMKGRMSWTLCLHAGDTFEEFQKAVLAVLEQHFGNHDLCGEWCKEKYVSDAEKTKLRLQCKDKSTNMYLHFKTHQDQFITRKTPFVNCTTPMT
jgi:hypothetical protein